MTHTRSVPVAVLVVEDEPLIRMVAADLLHEEGYRVVEANDAGEALALLEARPDVSVMLTDVRMPGPLDGFMLAHLVSKRLPNLGIIITSGHAVPERGDMPKGAVFLPKPYRPSAMLREVEAMASRASVEPEIAIRPEEAVVVPEETGTAEAILAPVADGAVRSTEPDEDG